MLETKEEYRLNLQDSYEFDVSVKAVENRYYAGTLTISQEQIKLLVYGESSQELDFFKYDFHIDKLYCHNFKLCFNLYNLNCISQGWTALDPNLPGSNPRVHCKSIYEVEYIETFKRGFSIKKYRNISIFSKDFRKWFGNTNNQQQLLFSNSYNPENQINISNHLIEDSIQIDENTSLGLLYNYEKYSSLDEKSAGLIFEPFICLNFFKDVEPEHAKKMAEKTITILSFFLGFDISVNYIEGTSFDYSIPGTKVTLYYKQHIGKRIGHQIIQLPYSKNQVFQTIELPKFEMNYFNNFFSMSDYEILFFKNFLKYNRYEFNEEKFLGYYRLLERLSYQEKSFFNESQLEHIIERFQFIIQDDGLLNKNGRSYIKWCKKVNKNKNNSISCIIKMFKKLPKKILENISFSIPELTEINMLRNNITHLNEYYITDDKLQKYCFILDFLCTFGLFTKVGYEVENFEQIFKRYKYFDHIRKLEK